MLTPAAELARWRLKGGDAPRDVHRIHVGGVSVVERRGPGVLARELHAPLDGGRRGDLRRRDCRGGEDERETDEAFHDAPSVTTTAVARNGTLGPRTPR